MMTDPARMKRLIERFDGIEEGCIMHMREASTYLERHDTEAAIGELTRVCLHISQFTHSLMDELDGGK